VTFHPMTSFRSLKNQKTTLKIQLRKITTRVQTRTAETKKGRIQRRQALESSLMTRPSRRSQPLKTVKLARQENMSTTGMTRNS